MHEIKTEVFYEDFSKNKEKFDFSNYSVKSKYYDNSKKLDVDKMEIETGVVAIEECIGLKTKVCLFLVNENSGNKKAKAANKNNV